jgi:hypothetical protein
MRKSLSLLILIILITSACNYPSANTPNSNQVDTQVALLLTTMPPTTTAPIPIQISITNTATIPSTQTETQLPTATLTATQTSTVMPTNPGLALGTPTWTNPNDWKGFYLNAQDSEIQITQSDGNLVMTAIHANDWHGYTLTYIKGTNFYLEATFKTGGCSGLDQYGLVFRAPDTTQGYFFSVSCDGQYSLRKWISSGFSDTDPISWTKSADILAGAEQVNQLGVKADGNQYSLYANGKLLGQVTDDSFLGKGIFGAQIASVNTPGFTVMVQSMRFWSLP